MALNARGMPTIEVVADLAALNDWATEAQIASEAEDPRRCEKRGSSATSTPLAAQAELFRSSRPSQELVRSESLQSERLSRTNSKGERVGPLSRSGSGHSTLEVPAARSRSNSGEAGGTLSRSASGHSNLDVPLSRSSSHERPHSRAGEPVSRSISRELPLSRSNSRLAGQTPVAMSPASSNLMSRASSKLGGSASSSRHGTKDLQPRAQSPPALELDSPTAPTMLQKISNEALEEPLATRALHTYANDQLVLLPSTKARSTPKNRQMSLGGAYSIVSLSQGRRISYDAILGHLGMKGGCCTPCRLAHPTTSFYTSGETSRDLALRLASL